ncbi:hypothetical protein [Acetohalobium arabaticum]|uniref:Uncharacterized protein n=1 Tax=Acetohalobium arabaticum (strain ATCC 49924 / DSM 5501 / Z-7288) TaxID=574087 RepID=D9QQZ5_ACEAZ|nr:hypothetical protein [Acetohalobium arabaticum]ADL12936.1 hypothetical protein Acear_1426 [Acetohalobium arabaticum DSM 5501]
MVDSPQRNNEFRIGDIVIKASETKQVYFEVTDITEDYIKIEALEMPLSTYVTSKEIVKIR